MDKYEEYISELPKPKTEEERNLLKKYGEPFLINDSIDDVIHMCCGQKTRTRIYEVFVPEEDTAVSVEYAHYGAKNPSLECANALRENLISKGTDMKMMDIYMNTFIKSSSVFNCENPRNKLAYAAKVSKITQEYSKNFE